LLGHINKTLEVWSSSLLLYFSFALFRLECHELILDSNNQMRQREQSSLYFDCNLVDFYEKTDFYILVVFPIFPFVLCLDLGVPRLEFWPRRPVLHFGRVGPCCRRFLLLHFRPWFLLRRARCDFHFHFSFLRSILPSGPGSGLYLYQLVDLFTLNPFFGCSYSGPVSSIRCRG
jgi:hypothetical protein